MKTSLKTLEKIMISLDSKVDDYLGDQLSDEQKEEKWICESSFYLFLEKAWPVLEPGSTFIPGWHAQAICEHLEALYYLDISRLLINCPPRVGKSNICSVAFPAWVWANDPSLSFLFSSYASSLSIRDSIKCRRLIHSPWYQSLWGSEFSIMADVNNKLRFDNNRGGYRIASSVGGSNTGFGGHFEITDDPNNVLESESVLIRESTNDWHDFVMSTRYAGTIDKFRRLVIQQRVHERDVSGNILNKDDARWIHLCLPMKFEPNKRCITIPLRMSKGKTWKDPRTKEKELLWPAGINEKRLKEIIEKDFRNDSYREAGQMQQRPSPEGGGIFKTAWFKYWTELTLPNFEYILQSWDTALVGKRPGEKSKDICYSACSTWGIFKDAHGANNLMLLSLYKGQIEYPELREMALRLAHNYWDTDLDNPLNYADKTYAVDRILIESKVSGYSLSQELSRTNLPITRFNPSRYGDKLARARRVSPVLENGLVWLMNDPNSSIVGEYGRVFLNDCELFPNAQSNDTVDTMSQAFIYLRDLGEIFNTGDYIPEPQPQKFKG
tara:strand:- start:6481 stop:8139 length:1659 start_codon:yes stop_codon:yes gene_type:complete